MRKMGNLSMRKIAIVIFVAVFVSGGFFFLYNRSAKQNDLLRDELKDFIVPTVSLDNKTYTVEKGEVKLAGRAVSVFTSAKVLRIAYASVLNRFSPIFGIEGTNPERLTRAVDDLDISLRKTASLYNSNDEKLINDNLYPIEFLSKLPAVEKARQDLLMNPSSGIANKYYKLLEELLTLNISYAKQLESTYQENEDRLNYKYSFFDGYATLGSFKTALEEIAEDVNTRLADLKKRESCLTSYSSDCPSLYIAFSNFSTSTEMSIEEKYKPMSNDTKKNAEILRAYLTESAGNNKSSQILSDQLIALDRSSCFRGDPTIYYLPWIKIDGNNNFFTIHFANDLYFRDVSKSTNGLIKSMANEGLGHLYQPAANLYMCQSIGSDLSRSLSMSELRTMLTRRSVLADEKIGKLASELSLLESTIVAGDTLYESDFDRYITGLKSLLSEYKEAGLSASIGSDAVLYLEKLISTYEQKTPRFDEIIRNVISNNSIVDTFIAGGVNFPIRHLLISRSYMPILLLSYNKSAHQSTMRLTTIQRIDINNFGLLSYNERLSKMKGSNETLGMMLFGWKLQHGN